MVKPLPPCSHKDYRGEPPYPKCGKPATGWLSQRYPGNLCQAHRDEALTRWDNPTGGGGRWLLTLRFRELAYMARYGHPMTVDEPRGLVAQVCPTCHGHGEIWVEPESPS